MNGYVNILKQADIFYKCTPQQLEIVAGLCREHTYQSNEIIFTEGSQSHELYIIAKGEVDILVDPNLVSEPSTSEYQPVSIATLRMGQSFGEISLVDEGLRSATACAAQDATCLLILPREQLIDLCKTDQAFGFRLMYNLAVDLALKIRNADLLIRQELLFSQQVENSSPKSG